MDTVKTLIPAKALAETSIGLRKTFSTRQLITLTLAICSLSAVSCSRSNETHTTQAAKLDKEQARVTLARYVWNESEEAMKYLKLGGGDPDFFAATVRVSDLQEKGDTVDAKVFWGQMFLILKGKTAESYQGEGKATFERKGEAWFLTKVSGPRDFERENLMVEVQQTR